MPGRPQCTAGPTCWGHSVAALPQPGRLRDPAVPVFRPDDIATRSPSPPPVPPAGSPALGPGPAAGRPGGPGPALGHAPAALHAQQLCRCLAGRGARTGHVRADRGHQWQDDVPGAGRHLAPDPLHRATACDRLDAALPADRLRRAVRSAGHPFPAARLRLRARRDAGHGLDRHGPHQRCRRHLGCRRHAAAGGFRLPRRARHPSHRR